MKQDEGPWQLDRLSAADAPELCRAVDAAKHRLPSAHELAALAASLSLPDVAPPNHDRSPVGRAAKPGFAQHWLVVGAAVLGATAICIALLRRPSAGFAPAPTRSLPVPGDSALGVGAAPAPAPGSAVPRSNQGTLQAKPSTPELAVEGEPAAPPSSSPAASGAVPEAKPISPSFSPAASETAPSTARSAVGSRTSQSPAGSVQGSSLGAGSKAQPSEIELLRDARLALQGSPALALGLTEQHSALYPRGSMVQERELIAISALARLGRHAAVLSRAQRFEHDFPSSPYRKQIAHMAE